MTVTFETGGNLSTANSSHGLLSFNLSTSESSGRFLRTTPWIATSFTLHVIGIIINLALAFAVCADRTSSAGPRLLIGNIALCGLILTLAVLPAITIQDLTATRDNVVQCKITIVTFFFIAVYSWADICLALNRTIAICFPHHYERFRQARSTLAIIISSWLFCLILSLLAQFQIGVVFEELAGGVCTIRIVTTFGMFYTALCSVVPYMLVGTAAAVIFITVFLRSRSAAWSTAEMAGTKRLTRRRLVLAKAMAGSLAWSVICTMPSLLFVSVFAEYAKKNPSMDRWTIISTFVLYTFNPVIYFLASPSYRQTIRQRVVCSKSTSRVKPSSSLKGSTGRYSEDQHATAASLRSGQRE